MSGKTIALALLHPFALCAVHLERARRLWAHARLSARIASAVDPSVVILSPAEIHGTGRIFLGRNLFLYRDLYLETQDSGEIRIGENVVLSRGVHIVSFARIEIGENSLIGEYTSVRDANHLRHTESVRTSGHSSKPIVIGRNVWIGRGVIVLGGVHIGDNAVVGANAVVTHDVPAGAVVMGIPARALNRAES